MSSPLVRQGETRADTRIFKISDSEVLLRIFPQQCSWDRGSAARIVRAGILWWLAVQGGDNCHSRGPLSASPGVCRLEV